ncbi:unnamed protein product [Strongylus vulgaris]|uniref:Innexin n=1 Tax=Strongylus vulgaris TaxID=40348 RepID=A0A3P7L7H1_STRVU|nr:unnamed protein product [Strongylus vulgaris]
MSFFERARGMVGHLDPTYDVDTSDRMKYVYTPWILCGTAFLVFAKEYVGTWGYKLTLALLFSKLLSIFVVVGEIFFIGWFMGAGQMHGLRVVVDALNGRQWESSGNFPRVTFCDLQVRELGGAVHRWSLQCVLMETAMNKDVDSRNVSDFCKVGLKTDGVTIIHLIEENATIYQAGEFVVPLWEEFMSAKTKVE